MLNVHNTPDRIRSGHTYSTRAVIYLTHLLCWRPCHRHIFLQFDGSVDIFPHNLYRNWNIINIRWSVVDYNWRRCLENSYYPGVVLHDYRDVHLAAMKQIDCYQREPNWSVDISERLNLERTRSCPSTDFNLASIINIIKMRILICTYAKETYKWSIYYIFYLYYLPCFTFS